MQRFLLNPALLAMLLAGSGVGVSAALPAPLQQDGPLHPPPGGQDQKTGGKSSDSSSSNSPNNSDDKKQPDKPAADDDSSSSSSSPAASSASQELQQEDKGKKFDPLPAEKDVKVGTYYMHKGSYDAAIARFQDAIVQKADYAKPRLLLAQLYEKKDDKISAVKYYKEYLQVYPHAPDAKKIQEKIARLSAR